MYSSRPTCHVRTPTGPGKSVRTLQVAAQQRADGHVEMCRDIDIVAVHSRWPLTTGSPKAGTTVPKNVRGTQHLVINISFNLS